MNGGISFLTYKCDRMKHIF